MFFKSGAAAAALLGALTTSGDAQNSAAKAPDINGFSLGMTGAQAKPMIEKMTLKHHLRLVKFPTTNEAFIQMAYGILSEPNKPSDSMHMYFSGPPTGNQATFIHRRLRFAEGQEPNREATIAALKEKYGEPLQVAEGGIEFGVVNGKRPATEAERMACQRGNSNLVYAMRWSMGVSDNGPFFRALYGASKVMQSQGKCDWYVFANWSFPSQKVGAQYVTNKNILSQLNVLAFEPARYQAAAEQDEAAMKADINRASQTAPKGGAAPKL
jgi:hypothetical protein